MWSQSDIKLPKYGQIIKLRYYFLFVRKHLIVLRCARNNLKVKKCLAYVEISLEQEPFDTFPAKKKYIPHFLNLPCFNSNNYWCKSMLYSPVLMEKLFPEWLKQEFILVQVREKTEPDLRVLLLRRVGVSDSPSSSHGL